MERKGDAGGLSDRAVSLLGFDTMCHCGHEDGLHDTNGKCAVLGCSCTAFQEDRQCAGHSTLSR